MKYIHIISAFAETCRKRMLMHSDQSQIWYLLFPTCADAVRSTAVVYVSLSLQSLQTRYILNWMAVAPLAFAPVSTPFLSSSARKIVYCQTLAMA